MRFFSRRRTHDDFSNEIQAHIALETDRLIADGMNEADARAAAQRAFGNVLIVKERFYETRRWVWLEQLLQDLRYAWRTMRRSPAFLATTVLTLAVGLGLLTVAFTIFNALVLRPFAIRDPQTLHQVVWHAKNAGGPGFRWRDYEDLSRRTDIFSAVVGEQTRVVSAADGRPLITYIVSPNYFEALGPTLQLGRPFGTHDGDATAGVAILTEQAWARTYDRDPAVIGRDIELNGRAFTIVGILAREFTGIAEQSGGCLRTDLVDLDRIAPRARQRGARNTSPRAAPGRCERCTGRDGDHAVSEEHPRKARERVRGSPAAAVAEHAVARDDRRALAGICRVRSRARHRVRERLERDARPGDRAASRTGRPAVHRREPRTSCAAAADRGPSSSARWPSPPSSSSRRSRSRATVRRSARWTSASRPAESCRSTSAASRRSSRARSPMH
jgi:hypothetical protein